MPTPSQRRVTLLAGLPAIIIAGFVSACGDGSGAIVEPNPVTTVNVTAPLTTIGIGQTVQLTATALDANGAVLQNQTFQWTTADPAVATVSTAGLVTGVGQGQVEIDAVAQGVAGGITITVTAPAAPGLQPIASGLNFPLYLTSPPGDDRLFVVEKAGAIRVIKGGAVLATPFLDLSSKVLSAGGELGLLGLAFAPDYASSGRFIVHYIDLSGDTRVSSFQVSGDPDQADPASESPLLAVAQPGDAHKGGQILFGPDGLLYIGLGDGADTDQGHGQSLGDLLGAILRIDISTGAPYTVPADNPFVMTPGARPEIWSYGLRNPWRFSFDRVTGDLYIGDVGESHWEEVNQASAVDGGGRGANYGWSRMEGRHCFRDEACDQAGVTLPVLEYGHPDGCSVISGYVYRGAAMPSLQGTYFYSDYCLGWVRSFRMQGGAVVEETDWPALRTGGRVTSFGEDAAGELYLVTEQGGVFKIVPQ